MGGYFKVGSLDLGNMRRDEIGLPILTWQSLNILWDKVTMNMV